MQQISLKEKKYYGKTFLKNIKIELKKKKKKSGKDK